MKITQLAAIAALSIIPFASNAQTWSGSTPGNIYYDSGNVSVGTSVTGFKLGVRGPSLGMFALLTPGTVQGERSASTFYATFQNTPDNGQRRTADIIAGFNGGAWGNEYLAFCVGYNGGANDGALPTLEKMRIASNGNVGIGTPTPDAKLAVKGTIHSQEVKVDMSVPGPDYVFHPTYKLPLLSEVKAYVDKNHHLSEIPSAAEMAKNGLDLGDMNMKLLKKVEELTLYLIEKDKQIEEIQLKQKNSEIQQNQIDALRKQVETLLKKKS